MTHYFRHNYATLLFEAGVEPLIVMRILGHTDLSDHCQHLHAPQIQNDEEIQRGYGGRIPQEAKSALDKAQTTRDKRSRKPALDMSLPLEGNF